MGYEHPFAHREHTNEPSRSPADLTEQKTAHFRHPRGPIVPLLTVPCNSYAINNFRVRSARIVALPLHKMGSETDRATRRNNVAKEDRGFASMDRAKQREIASKGGKAAHQKGTAHEWTSEEARDAGRKGGIASHRRRREAMNKTSPAGETTTGAAGDSQDMQNRERGDTGERSSSFERPDRTSDFAGNDRSGEFGSGERTETER
jgi:general stress protein YciG